LRGAPLLLLLAACAASPGNGDDANVEAQGPVVRHWGEMRTVLRQGRTEGRVRLADVVGPDTLALGALEGLAAEITVVDGTVHLAEVVDAAAEDGSRARSATAADRAALLVAADVPAWSDEPLGPVADLHELEERVGELAAARGLGREPFPFRVEGRAHTVRLHVLNGSCPIAHPDGPPPWRFGGADEATVLVGFHAEGMGGVLTHHGQATHTHAVLTERGVSGHLDDVSFPTGARLFLPRR